VLQPAELALNGWAAAAPLRFTVRADERGVSVIGRHVVLTLGVVAAVALVGSATGEGRGEASRSWTCVLRSGGASVRSGVRFPFEAAVERTVVVFSGARGLVAVVDRTRAAVVPTCAAAGNRRRAVAGLSGPWLAALPAKIICGTRTRNRLTFQASQILSKHKAVMGNEMIAALGREVVVRASVTASGGKVWFNPTYCLRTATP
jgi:hypothetical protein